MEAALRALDVKVGRRPMKSAWGVSFGATRVVVASGMSDERTRFALAHELGHVLCRLGRAPWVARAREELFADWFARELLLPTASAVGAASRLARTFAVEERTALLQLAARSRKPAMQVMADGTVLCAICGDRPHLPGCACRVVRTSAS